MGRGPGSVTVYLESNSGLLSLGAKAYFSCLRIKDSLIAENAYTFVFNLNF